MKESLEIITAANNTIQKIEELAAKNNDADIKNLIVALKNNMEKINKNFSLVLEENAKQKIEIEKLMAQLAGEHGFDVKNNVYYTSDGDGPFCPFCYEKKGRKTRLRKIDSNDSTTVHHACRVCENKF
ncbi:MAG: hypothetical protein GY754_07705 [bacterium]|nr:hypothetical protein [bacterium]